jgi:diguanylate cyclase (GGDEF)-like protein
MGFFSDRPQPATDDRSSPGSVPPEGKVRRTLARRNKRAMAAVGASLVALIAVITAGSAVTGVAATRSQRALHLATAYQGAVADLLEVDVSEEAFRIAPTTASANAYRRFEGGLDAYLNEISALGKAGDRRLAADVSVENKAYRDATATVFADVKARKPLPATLAFEAGTVQPLYTLMNAQVDRAATEQEASTVSTVAWMQDVGRFVLILDIATLLAGILTVLAASVVVRHYQRDLRDESEHNRYQALHDALTGLPNRTLFQDRTAAALRGSARSGTEVAVMLLDLNRFKEVNDTLGHQYGDALLLQVADRIARSLRGDDSVARLGGDEFAVLLPVSSWDGARIAAERIGNALGQFSVQDVDLEVDASIGVVIADDHDDVESLLRHADVAMYDAKRAHRPYARYEESRDDNSRSRLVLLGDLRRAVENDELILHFQPKIDVATGGVDSVEALVRWQHPTRGLIQPDEFIQIAENTAVIHPLTTKVLHLALAQARRWADRGLPISVAVNISVRSLLDVAFPEHVRRLLAEHGVDPQFLTLEITESAVMTDTAMALRVLQGLDALGIKLSIDDFGTGYSSMAYIKSLPVRELKIDRSFVMGMTADAGNALIVRSTIELGHNLGLRVVAEGVEDQGALEALGQMGCDLLQGYHVCRPVPVAELDRWLEVFCAKPIEPAEPIPLSGLLT